jgi:FkbM family methyltransferase
MDKQYHHPLIAALEPFEGWVKKNHLADCTGCLFDVALARPHHHAELFTAERREETARPEEAFVRTALPAFGEEYFEWIDLLESVQAARDSYVMLELGAGFGRWGVRAWRLARKKGLSDVRILLAEADPAHLQDLRLFLQDNAVPEKDACVVEAAVSNTAGKRFFHVLPGDPQSKNDPRDEYGQLLIPPQLDNHFAGNAMAKDYYGTALYDSQWQKQAIEVASLPLRELLQAYPRIDLVNLDIQGEEHSAIENGMDELNRRTRLMHISTHNADVERRLQELLPRQGWQLRYQFACKQENETPYGRFSFVDGRQSWMNTRIP